MNAVDSIQSGVTSGVMTDYQQKNNSELQRVQSLKENNPFDKFDNDSNGKISGTEIAAMKVVLAGIYFGTDSDGSIDESAFNSAFRNAEFEAK